MLQTILATILFVGTGIVMLAPQVPLIRKVSEYSVHIMLGMFIFSLLSMVVGKSKIMFTGLACTAALCVFLKNASLDTFNYSDANTESKLNVAHINLGNITFEFDAITEVLNEEEIDVVSFQEFTPNWRATLENGLIEKFPYSRSEVRIDPYGLAVFSKALDNKSLIVAANQLGVIADKVNSSDRPLIALGEYNMVYWTNEIRNFRSKTNLQNSRRDLVDGNLRVPYDHIFFSNALECTQFKEMKDVSQNYIGIMGTYQIKKEEVDYQTLNSQLSLND